MVVGPDLAKKQRHKSYSVSTNFRLGLMEPSAREVFFGRKRWAIEERRREHGSSLARLEIASQLKKTVNPQPL